MSQTNTSRIRCEAPCMVMTAAPLTLVQPPKYRYKFKYRQAALSFTLVIKRMFLGVVAVWKQMLCQQINTGSSSWYIGTGNIILQA